MLNVRAIATLGVGYGARLLAYLGIWPSAPTERPAILIEEISVLRAEVDEVFVMNRGEPDVFIKQ